MPPIGLCYIPIWYCVSGSIYIYHSPWWGRPYRVRYCPPWQVDYFFLWSRANSRISCSSLHGFIIVNGYSPTYVDMLGYEWFLNASFMILNMQWSFISCCYSINIIMHIVIMVTKFHDAWDTYIFSTLHVLTHTLFHIWYNHVETVHDKTTSHFYG